MGLNKHSSNHNHLDIFPELVYFGFHFKGKHTISEYPLQGSTA